MRATRRSSRTAATGALLEAESIPPGGFEPRRWLGDSQQLPPPPPSPPRLLMGSLQKARAAMRRTSGRPSTTSASTSLANQTPAAGVASLSWIHESDLGGMRKEGFCNLFGVNADDLFFVKNPHGVRYEADLFAKRVFGVVGF